LLVVVTCAYLGTCCYYHQIEALVVGTLLKFPTLEALVYLALLKL
jgi:hypothetical protein